MTDREFLCWLHGAFVTLSKAEPGTMGPATARTLAERIKEHLTTPAKQDKVYR